MEFNFILNFIDVVSLQMDFFGMREGPLGSDDPMIKGVILSMLAVAGFGMEDLDITKEKNVLKVIGTSPVPVDGPENMKYLHKGIGSRNFRREFTLAEHINIVTAELRLGMLNIHLKLEVPEDQKPQKISITETN